MCQPWLTISQLVFVIAKWMWHCDVTIYEWCNLTQDKEDIYVKM